MYFTKYTLINMRGNNMNEIKIPIKDIIEKSMRSHSSLYSEESIALLRKYFIACMNLRFIEPEYLKNCVDEFTKKF